MSKVAHLDKNGRQISVLSWTALKEKEPNAWQLKVYENDRVRLVLNAIPRIFNADAIPPEHWMRFEVEVWNIITKDIEGNDLPAPKQALDTDASKKFRSFGEALAAYQRFLAQYTESRFDDETGDFIEKGNKIIPPNPDAPTVPVESVSEKAAPQDFGSW